MLVFFYTKILFFLFSYLTYYDCCGCSCDDVWWKGALRDKSEGQVLTELGNIVRKGVNCHTRLSKVSIQCQEVVDNVEIISYVIMEGREKDRGRKTESKGRK